jgi:hypothetical protein
LKILELRAFPQPNPSQIAFLLDGPADRVELRSYSVAETRLGSLSGGPFSAGWNRLSLPPDWAAGQPNGLFYLRAEAFRGGQRAAAPKPLRVLVLR